MPAPKTKKTKRKRRKNGVAAALNCPAFQQRIIPDKRRKRKYKKVED